MSKRRLLVYHYEYIQNYIESSNYYAILNRMQGYNYTNYKTISDGYCDNICDFFNSIINSKKDGIIIRNVFDLISAMVKCKNLKEWFIMNRFIRNLNEKDNRIISLEINHIIFTSIIHFRKDVEKEVYRYIKPYENECKIGIQLRDDDMCVIYNHCRVNKLLIENIMNLVSNYNKDRKCWLLISSANKFLISAISSKYKKTLSFMPNINPTHSSIVNNNLTYIKTLGDIIFPSLADYLIISEHSTYSKVILYKFFNKNKRNDFIFINKNGEINNNEEYTELKDNFNSKNCIKFPEF